MTTMPEDSLESFYMNSEEEKLTSNIEETSEGGFAWFIVFASFMIHVLVDGVYYSLGVLLTEIIEHFQVPRESVGWMASIMVGLTYLTGPLSSFLGKRYGYHLVTMAGGMISGIAFGASYFYQEFWFLFLTASVISGLGFGLSYLPSIVVVNIYFNKRRALATGLVVCGSGIGTFIFSPVIELLIDTYGWQGSMLIVSGIILNVIACGALYKPKTRKSPDEYLFNVEKSNGINNQVSFKNQEQISTHSKVKVVPQSVSNRIKNLFNEMFDIEVLKQPIFLLFITSNFFANLGYDSPFLYAKDRALLIGLDTKSASFLISSMGIGNTVGRIIFGYLATKKYVKRFFLFNMSLICSGIIIMLSSFAVIYSWMIVYTISFGILIGIYVTLTPVVLVDLFGISKLDSAFGMTLIANGTAIILGPPLTGWIYDKTNSYDYAFWVCGALMTFSGLMLCLTYCKKSFRNQPLQRLNYK